MAGVGSSHPKHPDLHLLTPTALTTFPEAATSVSSVVVAFIADIAFFGFMSEMAQPTDFAKSLALVQSTALSFYLVVAIVIYRYIGTLVHSPALTSTSNPLVRNIAWGVATPTIIVAGVVNASIAVKCTYVRIWRDWLKKKHVMREKSLRAYGSWVALCAGAWALAWVIASAVPVFGDLLGLLGALFCSWFSMGLPACFWFYMNKGSYGRDWGMRLLCVVNGGILVVCCFVVSGFSSTSSYFSSTSSSIFLVLQSS